MSKKHIEFELDINKLATIIGIAIPLLCALFCVWNAGQTHEFVNEIQEPRIKALEQNDYEYQTMWKEQIKERQQKIEHAFEVCRKTGECD